MQHQHFKEDADKIWKMKFVNSYKDSTNQQQNLVQFELERDISQDRLKKCLKLMFDFLDEYAYRTPSDAVKEGWNVMANLMNKICLQGLKLNVLIFCLLLYYDFVSIYGNRCLSGSCH